MVKVRLEQILKEKGKSFYWLSKETGINQASMSMIRHNKLKTLNLDYLSRICIVLDVQPGDILCEDGRTPKKKGTIAPRG